MPTSTSIHTRPLSSRWRPRSLCHLVFGGISLLLPQLSALAQSGGFGSAGLDNYVLQKMQQMRAPGLAVAVIKDDRVIFSKGYGLADVERQIPTTADTPFYMASISKTFTATAIMQLVERGAVGLDDDINVHLPFAVRNPYFPNHAITVRMLLTHDSSIHTREEILPVSSGADSPVTLENLLSNYLLPGGTLYDPVQNFNQSPPGTEQEYCNVGYGLLGLIVQRASGLSFHEYCRRNLFVPLGMTNTSFRLADFPQFTVAPAQPYLFNHTTQSYAPFAHFGNANYPATTLRTSANQLAKWLVVHMNGGAYGQVRILHPQTVELMQSPTHDLTNAHGFSGYGLGLYAGGGGPTEREIIIGHGGLYYGAATEMHYRPAQRVGAIALANTGGGIANPSGVREIAGREHALYSMIVARLMDEAAALP